MRLRTRLRAHSALWAAPLAMALTLLVYYTVSADPVAESSYGYAPTLVAGPLSPLYPFAYALASALGAWEGNRLARVPVWRLAPTRSRYRVALDALWPAVLLVWLMLALPVVIALVQEGVAPTVESLRPLALAWLVAAAHTVIGFAVGLRVPDVVAAPVLAVVVFLLVATAVAVQIYWWRHIAGRYPHIPEFGEAATWTSMAAHALPTCGIALALALLWLPLPHLGARVALSAVVGVACVVGAYAMVKDWGAEPPVARGHAPMSCAGEKPEVCMPEATDDVLPAVRAKVAKVVGDLRKAGVDASPTTVADSLPRGGGDTRSTANRWEVPLTEAERRGDLGYQVVRTAVRFPCAAPEPTNRRLVLGWAADKAGQSKTFARILAEDPSIEEKERQEFGAALGTILGQSEAEQKRWYTATIQQACAEGGDKR